MTDQGKANYEGYRKALHGMSPISGKPIPGYEDQPRNVQHAFDAGADAVELWLSQAPVDEDMPGNEPEAAKVIIVVETHGPERRYSANTWSAGEAGGLSVERSTRKSDPILAMYADGAWQSVREADATVAERDAEQELINAYGENDQIRALLVRAVRELAGSGSPGQNRLAAELARDGGIEP